MYYGVLKSAAKNLAETACQNSSMPNNAVILINSVLYYCRIKYVFFYGPVVSGAQENLGQCRKIPV